VAVLDVFPAVIARMLLTSSTSEMTPDDMEAAVKSVEASTLYIKQQILVLNSQKAYLKSFRRRQDTLKSQNAGRQRLDQKKKLHEIQLLSSVVSKAKTERRVELSVIRTKNSEQAY